MWCVYNPAVGTIESQHQHKFEIIDQTWFISVMLCRCGHFMILFCFLYHWSCKWRTMILSAIFNQCLYHFVDIALDEVRVHLIFRKRRTPVKMVALWILTGTAAPALHTGVIHSVRDTATVSRSVITVWQIYYVYNFTSESYICDHTNTVISLGFVGNMQFERSVFQVGQSLNNNLWIKVSAFWYTFI